MGMRSDLSYETLLPDSERVEIGEFSVRVLTRKKLLSLKLGIQSPRAKDLLDIECLRRHVP